VHTTDEVAAQLAQLQRGAFARWQLRGRGVADTAIHARVRSGRWLTALPGVYVLAGVPSSFEQHAWIGWLAVGPDALVSHEAAAQLQRIPNVARNRITLIAAHGKHQRLAGVFVHQLDDVLPEHRTAVRGLPVTTPPRTIVDLAAVVHPARLLPVVEDTNHARIASYLEIGRCMASVARRGKPGVRQLAKVLDRLTATKAKTMTKMMRPRTKLYPCPLPELTLRHCVRFRTSGSAGGASDANGEGSPHPPHGIRRDDREAEDAHVERHT
jgi:hypothetical protein